MLCLSACLPVHFAASPEGRFGDSLVPSWRGAEAEHPLLKHKRNVLTSKWMRQWLLCREQQELSEVLSLQFHKFPEPLSDSAF